MGDIETHRNRIHALQSRTAKLAYAIENYDDIVNNDAFKEASSPIDNVSGRDGYKIIQKHDKNFLASHLVSVRWDGQKAEKAALRMAEKTFDVFKLGNATFDEKWDLGRLLLSSFTFAGIYTLVFDGEHENAPLVMIDIFGPIPEEGLPERTQHEPFPRWTSNKDDFGNRLVYPSSPCPSELEFVPNVNPGDDWVKAVHQLESTAFKINEEVLEWALKMDQKTTTRIVPKEPPASKYRNPRSALNKKYKQEGLKQLEQQKKEKSLTLEQENILKSWHRESRRLESLRWRTIARRSRYDREVQWAIKLAENNKPFYQRVSMDFRGTLYLPDFSYQGSDFCRAVIEFAEQGIMTKYAVLQLHRHIVNMRGENLSHDAKFVRGFLNADDWLALLQTDPDKEIRNADKPFCYYRALLELSKHRLHQNFATKPLHRDGSSLLDYFGDSKSQSKTNYESLELKKITTPKYKHQDLPVALNNQQLVTYLPILADHRHSAFHHIGMMIRGNEGEELLSRCQSADDLFMEIGGKLLASGGIKTIALDIKQLRKLVKAIVIPWSYGDTKYSCQEMLFDYRRNHAGEIPYLDSLDSKTIVELVDTVCNILETEFPVCLKYREKVTKYTEIARNKIGNIEWSTASGFKIAHAFYESKKIGGNVFIGLRGKTIMVETDYPLNEIDWERMKKEVPKNLTHSQDAAVVHILLAGSTSLGLEDSQKNYFNPVVTDNYSFSTLPCDASQAVLKLKEITKLLYEKDLFTAFLQDITGEKLSPFT